MTRQGISELHRNHEFHRDNSPHRDAILGDNLKARLPDQSHITGVRGLKSPGQKRRNRITTHCAYGDQ